MASNIDEKAVLPGRRPSAGRDATRNDSTGTGTGSRNRTPRRPGGWWKVHLFRGMVNDLRRRAPFYVSDWTDAWDYRVVPATVYMYFAKYVRLVVIICGFHPSTLSPSMMFGQLYAGMETRLRCPTHL